MKDLASAIILISFVGMAVFGAFGIGHSAMHNHDCIASTVTGSPCPTNLFDLLSHYIAAVKTFSAALPSASTIALLLFLLFVSILGFVVYTSAYSSPLSFCAYRRKDREQRHLHWHSFLNWLALFEHSPSF